MLPLNDNSQNRISTTTPSPRKSMEEVWEDINLPCILDRPSTAVIATGNHSAFPGMIFQDFLGRPFGNKDPPGSAADQYHHTHTAQPSSRVNNEFLNSLLGGGGGGGKPATLLSLNSTSSDLQFLENGNVFRKSNLPMACCNSTPIFGGKKRVQDQDLENSGDRRNKRMIKNRESAARSRAKKQAYTQELEVEAAQLRKENAKLRRQQNKLFAVPAKLPKKSNLHRTLTAPF